MNQIISQVKRMFYDDGRHDKDFTQKEVELRIARDKLNAAVEEFRRASESLYNSLLENEPPRH